MNAGGSQPFDSMKEREQQKSLLERMLSLAADVHAGEGVGVVILLVNVFLLLGAYYLLKTAREPLILTQGGAAVKTYSSAGQAGLLLLVIPLYGWVGTKVNRLKLLNGAALFFVLNLLVFAALGTSGMRIGVAFYIWLGIFNMFTVSQFWAFANDIYTEAQGKRLFPVIGIGASFGALVGSTMAGRLMGQLQLSPYTVMYIASGILLVTATLTWAANRRATTRGPAVQKEDAGKPLGKDGAWKLIFSQRYLTWIAILFVVLNIVNTVGEYVLDRLLVDASIAQFGDAANSLKARISFIGAFKGSYLTWANLIGLLIQTFLVSRIIKAIGVRGGLFVLPCLSLVSYTITALAPVLSVIRIAKIGENATDYSLQNTIRPALFLPTSREAKYKAKAAIDTFCQRFGDVTAAGAVYAGENLLHAGVVAFASFNVALTLIWLGVARQIGQEHRKFSPPA